MDSKSGQYTNIGHFVDIAETDWSTTEPAPKRTIKRPRATARAQPNKADTTSSISVSSSPSIQHQPQLPSLRTLFPPECFPAPTGATMPRRQAGGDEDEDYTPHSKRQKSLPHRASQEEPSATDSQCSESRFDFELDAAYTAASYRPNPRRSATVAYDRISQTSRTPRQPRRVEQQEELAQCQQSESRRKIQQNQCVDELQTSPNHVTSEASRGSRHLHFTGPQQQQHHRHVPQSQTSSNAPVKPSPLSNMSLLRDFEHLPTELTAASGRPVRGAMARALDRMSNQNQAGSLSAVQVAGEDFRSDSRPAKPLISREQQRKQNLIMVLYRSIFDSKLKEFPSLMTFRPIPDTWQEPSPCASSAPPAPQSLNNNIPQRADFDAFHQHSLNSILRMKTPYGGPAVPIPPLGYESYSFQNYPSTHKTNEYHSTAADVFGQAVPSLRTTPKYHPTNDMTPEEIQRYHNDRRLFVKMKAAWVDNDKILRLREQKGDEEALQTLWDVAQVFRTRNPINPSAESVKWFVDKRDEILRPRGRSQRQSASAPAGEEGGASGNVEDLLDAAVAAEEMEIELEPMDVEELENELGNQEMPQAENDNDGDDEHDVDELAPAFGMLQQLELQQQHQQHQQQQALVSHSIHYQDYDADVDTPETQSKTDEQERHGRAHSERAQSKGRLGINDLLN
ncbi:hypothetical protein NEUTE2DRAFT_48795 [Neurospora tetrasperma FGSC 2509]|nr:hypothetical protein NEUTE2DRAFT_48795 [Neurospora tetrasperma FGSC 2509]